jgi:hypothetical protein
MPVSGRVAIMARAYCDRVPLVFCKSAVVRAVDAGKSGYFGFHSLARFCASAICSEVISSYWDQTTIPKPMTIPKTHPKTIILVVESSGRRSRLSK